MTTPQAEVDVWIALFRQGLSINAIAKRTGAIYGTVRNRLIRAGVLSPGTRDTVVAARPIDHPDWLRRRADGEPCAAIAADANVTKQAVWEYCRRHGGHHD